MPDDYVEEVVVSVDDVATLTEVDEEDLVEEDIDIVDPLIKKPLPDVEEEEALTTPEEEEMEEIEQLLDPYGEREDALY